MRIIYFTSFAFLLVSCATLINKPYTQIEIYTDSDSSEVKIGQSFWVKTPAVIEVPRSIKDFNIKLKVDTLEKTVTLKSKTSPEFKWGNLFFVYGSPIAYMLDASAKEKLFGYDHVIKVNMLDTNNSYKKWSSSRKKQWNYRLSLPVFNSIGYDNGLEFSNYKLYWGLVAGFDYYHSRSSFVSLSGGITGFFRTEWPAPVDYFYADTIITNRFYSAKFTNNHDLHLFSSDMVEFSLGYGLSLTNFQYSRKVHDTTDYYLIKNEFYSSKTNLGICFNGNVTLFKLFFAGVNIMPGFVTFNPDGFSKLAGSNLFYVDFGVKLPINMPKQQKMEVYNFTPLYNE